MKTLDGVITRLNAAGEKQSINSKCADLDREVIITLYLFMSCLHVFVFMFYLYNFKFNQLKRIKEIWDSCDALYKVISKYKVIFCHLPIRLSQNLSRLHLKNYWCDFAQTLQEWSVPSLVVQNWHFAVQWFLSELQPFNEFYF